MCVPLLLKSYLHQKLIPSQNVPSEAQAMNFFYFIEKLWSILEIFDFCIFLPIPWFTKSVTSWWLWDRVHFWTYLLSHNLLSPNTWSIDRYKPGQCKSGELRPSPRPFQFSSLPQLLNNQLCQISGVSFFWKSK